MSLTIREVEKIAELANLKFTVEELGCFVEQFQEILDYVDLLQAVSDEDVQPTYHAVQEAALGTPLRQDDVESSFSAATALANAPDSDEDHFRVPAVIE